MKDKIVTSKTYTSSVELKAQEDMPGLARIRGKFGAGVILARMEKQKKVEEEETNGRKGTNL